MAEGYKPPIVNGVPQLVITMARAHRAWALRFMPWTLKY